MSGGWLYRRLNEPEVMTKDSPFHGTTLGEWEAEAFRGFGKNWEPSRRAKQCVMISTNLRVITSLWRADRLDALFAIASKVVVMDIAHFKLSNDPSNQPLAALISGQTSKYEIATTVEGQREIARLKKGEKPRENAEKLALTHFMLEDDGATKYLESYESVLLLCDEDEASELKLFNRPSGLGLLTTGQLTGTAGQNGT